MLDVFINIIRKLYVGTNNIDDSRSTQEVCQTISNLKQEWKGVNGKTVALTLDVFFDKYLALSICLPYNLSLWPINLCTVYFTNITSEVLYRMVSENASCQNCNYSLPMKHNWMHYNFLGKWHPWPKKHYKKIMIEWER